MCRQIWRARRQQIRHTHEIELGIFGKAVASARWTTSNI
jgi:hypothetical protein